MMFDYGNGDWGWGSWLLMTTTMLLFWGLLLGTIIWSVQAVTSSHSSHASSNSTPDEILAQRFARGEIDEDEYKGRRAALTEGQSR